MKAAPKKPHDYKVRYFVEGWNKPIPEKTTPTNIYGVRTCHTNYGYTDILFVGSVVFQPDGTPSVLFLESESKNNPKFTAEDELALYELIRNQLDHHIECHLKPALKGDV